MAIKSLKTCLMLIFLMGGFFLSNCSIFKKKVTEPEIFKLKIESLAPDQYQNYISELKKISRESRIQTVKQKSHILIAQVSVYHKNPAPDYDLALEEFEEYLRIRPEMKQKDDILNWIRLLQQMKKIKNEIKVIGDQLDTEKQNSRKLKDMLNEQQKKINKLSSDIKKLDSLYFNIEKKKKKKNNNQ